MISTVEKEINTGLLQVGRSRLFLLLRKEYYSRCISLTLHDDSSFHNQVARFSLLAIDAMAIVAMKKTNSFNAFR